MWRHSLRETSWECYLRNLFWWNFDWRGLNQKTTLKRAGDTRWGSSYGTLINLIGLFSSVFDVLLVIEEDGMLAK